MENRPFIHLFKTPQNYYVYDVNTDTILKINSSTYDYLKDGNSEKESSNEALCVNKMVADGFLSSNKIQEVYHNETDYLGYYLNSKIKMITLQITQNCNLHCSYCAYSGNYENRTHKAINMDITTAKRGIDFLIKHSADNDTIGIGFYGGEPLLTFDTIKECVYYAEQKGEGKNVMFSLTTNGTLINEEIIKFFEKHDVNITISIDGPREIHDSNRKFAKSGTGSFDLMLEKIYMIKNKYPEYYEKRILFNTVVDPKNDFECVNHYISGNELFSDSQFTASLISDRYTNKQDEFPEVFVCDWNYEMFKVMLHKLNRLDRKNISKILLQKYDSIKRDRSGKKNVMTKLPHKAHHSGPCIPGASRLFLSVDGTFYPCERVSETSEVMKIGNLDAGIDIEKAKQILNVGKISEEECKNCWAFVYCDICAGAVDNLKELSPDMLKPRCKILRRGVEENLKDYCVLREFGHDFLDDMEFVSYH